MNLLVKNFVRPVYKSLREGFGQALLNLGQENKKLTVLTADLASSTKVDSFAHKFPERFFQLGVAEQNLVGVGAGLALQGKISVCCSFATFLSRAWEQIRVAVASQDLNVKLVGSHAGLSHPGDGFTAQATEDIALFRVLPNMKVIYPADYNQMLKATRQMIVAQGPFYLRMAREKTPVFLNPKSVFKLGQAQVLKSGKDITLISAGPLLYEVLQAAFALEKRNISCEVINLHTIKPIDHETLISSCQKTKKVLTIEDHQLQAGLGSAVAETVSQVAPIMIKFLGINNQFTTTGESYPQLLKNFQLDAEAIYKKVLTWF